ncbi:hypothetical protein ACGF07_31935 [Kitasatospora sp. NPDC048194]|uniref:hypothetical protein n=1 Tax=Kitasatospora sp. NPDC048194 TaxID=3364045 RepID=UPI003713B715
MDRDRLDELTPAARATGARYAHVLDLVQRCANAVTGGSWAYLAEVAGELSAAADELSAQASALTREAQASGPRDVLAATVDHVTGVRHEELIEQLHRPRGHQGHGEDDRGHVGVDAR